ncbi:RNA-binding protein [Pseudomonas sp. LB1P83]
MSNEIKFVNVPATGSEQTIKEIIEREPGVKVKTVIFDRAKKTALVNLENGSRSYLYYDDDVYDATLALK